VKTTLGPGNGCRTHKLVHTGLVTEFILVFVKLCYEAVHNN